MQLHKHSEDLTEQDLKFFFKTPYVYHCHHFNLFHDQTVEDAVGEERGFEIKSRAAQHAVWHLLSDLVQEVGATTPAERLQAATALFPWLGQGQLELLGEAHGGEARGAHLHYSLAWREKYGAKVRRQFPIDAFAAGFATAATEVAFGVAPGTLTPQEDSCFACREPACHFAITEDGSPNDTQPVDRDAVLARVQPPIEGLEESTIAKIAQGLKDFLLQIESDERGLVQGFGVYVTRHLASYYDQTAYDTIHHIERHHAASGPAVEGLFGESGHVCVFYTAGNIILSPEWEALVGPVKGDVEEIVVACTAISRALGFGHWVVKELEPHRRLVVQSTSNYEAPFYLHRYGKATRPRCYFLANAARAFMQLAHNVDWQAKPMLDDELYQNLFKKTLKWNVEETRCQSKGDDLCEVVVTRS